MPKTTIVFLSLIGVFLIGFFLVLPQYEHFKEVSSEVKQKEGELYHIEEYFSGIRKTAEALRQYEEEISKIESAFPDDPSLPSLFRFLAATASQNGLIFNKIEKFSVAASKQNPRLKEIYLELSFVGSYPAFRNFLSSVEKTTRMVSIENINFTAPIESEMFSFVLKMKTHSY